MEIIFIYLIAIILIEALLVFIIYKVLKSFAKAFLIVNAIFMIIFLVFAFLVYSDIKNLSDNFPRAKKLFLLHDNGAVLTGFSATSFDEAGITVLSGEEISALNSRLKSNGYGAVLGNNYKLILFDIKSFEGEGTIEFQGMQIPKRVYITALKADNPIDVFADYYVESSALEPNQRDVAKQQAEAQLGTDTARIKTAMFTMLFTNAVEKQGADFFANLKNGNIVVYPETMFFSILKIVPTSLFENIGKNIAIQK